MENYKLNFKKKLMKLIMEEENQFFSSSERIDERSEKNLLILDPDGQARLATTEERKIYIAFTKKNGQKRKHYFSIVHLLVIEQNPCDLVAKIMNAVSGDPQSGFNLLKALALIGNSPLIVNPYTRTTYSKKLITSIETIKRLLSSNEADSTLLAFECFALGIGSVGSLPGELKRRGHKQIMLDFFTTLDAISAAEKTLSCERKRRSPRNGKKEYLLQIFDALIKRFTGNKTKYGLLEALSNSNYFMAKYGPDYKSEKDIRQLFAKK